MNTPVPIPGLTVEPYHEPVISLDIAVSTSWAVVYVNGDGERITGLTGDGDPPGNMVAALNSAAERQRLKGRFEIETLHRVAESG